MDFKSWLIYSSVLLFTYTSAFISEECKFKGIFQFLSFICVFLFCSFRYNIGFDYQGYVSIFTTIYCGVDTYVEPGYLFLNNLFLQSSIGYIFVLSVMSFFTFLLLYKTFEIYNILSYGIYFTFVFQLIFMINNQVRQGFVLAGFMYAFHFLEESKNWKYILIIIVLSIFHISALFLLLPLLFRKINLKYYIWILLIIVSFVIYLTGIYDILIAKIFPYIPFYEKYLNTERADAEAYTHVLIVVFWVVLSVYIGFKARYTTHKLMYNVYMIGAVLYPAVVNFHLLNRFNLYFFYLLIPLSAIVSQKDKNFRINCMIIGFVFFSIYCLNNWGLDGGYPYQTVFTSKLYHTK